MPNPPCRSRVAVLKKKKKTKKRKKEKQLIIRALIWDSRHLEFSPISESLTVQRQSTGEINFLFQYHILSFVVWEGRFLTLFFFLFPQNGNLSLFAGTYTTKIASSCIVCQFYFGWFPFYNFEKMEQDSVEISISFFI